MGATKQEHIEIIRDYMESSEFEYKFKMWTHKTCKEVIHAYWKLIAAVSSAFTFIIVLLLSYIFSYFNTTISTLQDTTQELTKSVVRLEQTVTVMTDKNFIIHK